MSFPPIEEHEQIVAHIKTKNATIDAAKAEIEIELLKEYKEAVMGEMKMTPGN